MLAEPERLGSRFRSIAADQDTELLLSAASSWEIAIKHSTGRLPLPEPPHLFVPRYLDQSGVRGLPVQHHHALGVGQLAWHHRDPFDRLLVAQAQLEQLPLVTADPVFAAYQLELIPALD